MHDDLAAALTLLHSLSRVGLADRLRADDPGLLEEATAVLSEARALRSAAETAGIHFAGWQHDHYPAALLGLPDMPPGLWYRGDLTCLRERTIAIVGSRAGSSVALETAAQLASDLASRGVVIVSGLARGVDSAAHRGALAGNGRTVAVLGSGLRRLYPAEHRLLAAAIEARGAVVSEYPPDVPALPFHFPLRNRIISGLSRAVVVIEASEGSGSLITAMCALEQGRDVLAVPGNVLSGRNRGGHALIRDGAAIVETADDIVEAVGWHDLTRRALDALTAIIADGSGSCLLAGMERGVEYDVDQMASARGVDAAMLLTELTALELEGRVRRVGGGRFVRAA